MDEEKFRIGLSKKLPIIILDKEFDIDLKVGERMQIVNFLVLNSKSLENDKLINQKHVDEISKILLTAFKRNYPETEEATIAEFVDVAFEQILAGIAIASGWTTKEQMLKNVQGDKKKESGS